MIQFKHQEVIGIINKIPGINKEYNRTINLSHEFLNAERSYLETHIFNCFR